MESFLSKFPSNHPTWFWLRATAVLIKLKFSMEKDGLCKCLPLSEEISVFASSLQSLIAVFYTFNLEYPECWKYLFKILEEHVLDVPLERKSYALKQLENRLLKNLNGASSSV